MGLGPWHWSGFERDHVLSSILVPLASLWSSRQCIASTRMRIDVLSRRICFRAENYAMGRGRRGEGPGHIMRRLARSRLGVSSGPGRTPSRLGADADESRSGRADTMWKHHAGTRVRLDKALLLTSRAHVSVYPWRRYHSIRSSFDSTCDTCSDCEKHKIGW